MTYQSWNVMDFLQKEIDCDSVDSCINGKCSNCGSCCTNFLAVTDQEISRIRNYIRKHNIKPCSHGFTAPMAKQPVDMICPFRDEEKKLCTIYEVRPLICWGYQCNKTLEAFAADMFRKGYVRGKRHYVNLRLTFFGAENMEDQVTMTRVLAMKQKKAFGIDADEWL